MSGFIHYVQTRDSVGLHHTACGLKGYLEFVTEIRQYTDLNGGHLFNGRHQEWSGVTCHKCLQNVRPSNDARKATWEEEQARLKGDKP